jgi:hypothetical protein
MSPAIHLIDDLPAVLAIFRYRDGGVLVLAAVAPSGSWQVGRPSDQRVAGVAASTPTAVFAQGAVQSARIRRSGLLVPAAAVPVRGGFARLAQD